MTFVCQSSLLPSVRDCLERLNISFFKNPKLDCFNLDNSCHPFFVVIGAQLRQAPPPQGWMGCDFSSNAGIVHK